MKKYDFLDRYDTEEEQKTAESLAMQAIGILGLCAFVYGMAWFLGLL